MTTTEDQTGEQTSRTIDGLKPGQTVRCTITRMPPAAGRVKTVERLMRRDPDAVRGLRRAQMLRIRRMHKYIRGNRLYSSREKAARVVVPSAGASWTMPFTLDIAPDLRAVAPYLSIESV